MKITKEVTCNVGEYSSYGFLGDASTILEKAGLLVKNKLILHEGTTIRIEAFKAWSSAENWPYVKITIYPEGSKSAKCYVSLPELDGASWDPVPEAKVEPKPAPILKKVTVEIDKNYWNDRYGFLRNDFYHEAFGREYYKIGSGERLINPLVFSEEERGQDGFTIPLRYTLAECLVKIGKEHWNYLTVLERTAFFKFKLGKGVTTADLEKITYRIFIMEKPYPGKESPELYEEYVQEMEKITQEMVRKFSKEKIEKIHKVE